MRLELLAVDICNRFGRIASYRIYDERRILFALPFQVNHLLLLLLLDASLHESIKLMDRETERNKWTVCQILHV